MKIYVPSGNPGFSNETEDSFLPDYRNLSEKDTLVSQAGLPDGIFSNQKSQFVYF
jgi:hypothetical protein